MISPPCVLSTRQFRKIVKGAGSGRPEEEERPAFPTGNRETFGREVEPVLADYAGARGAITAMMAATMPDFGGSSISFSECLSVT